jgi:hypothetical protein
MVLEVPTYAISFLICSIAKIFEPGVGVFGVYHLYAHRTKTVEWITVDGGLCATRTISPQLNSRNLFWVASLSPKSALKWGICPVCLVPCIRETKKMDGLGAKPKDPTRTR